MFSEGFVLEESQQKKILKNVFEKFRLLFSYNDL